MRVYRLIGILLAICLLAGAQGLVPAHADNFSSPQAMLTSYYNDISLKQYKDAYAFWINPPQTFDAFSNGFADTDHVTPYLGNYIAGTGNTGSMAGVLVGYRNDGSIITYHGCFTITYDVQKFKGWMLSGASFSLLSNGLPDNDLILDYLTSDCGQSATQVPTLTPTPAATADNFGGNADSVFAMLTKYYELVNRKDYANAYAMWLHPLPGPKPNGAPPADYRLPYDQFVSGYSTTKFVDVYPGIYDESGGFMGHGYVDGQFPVLMVGEHTDGTYVGYIGCYVMGGMQGINPGIISGSFKKISDGPDVLDLKTTLPQLKTICTDMAPNLQY